MSKKSHSYLSPKLKAYEHPLKGGKGVFASEHIDKGEVLAVWGGVIVDLDSLDDYSEHAQTHGIQVEDNLFLLPLDEDSPADYFNHSCDPNSGLSGQICLVSMRQIEVGEEVCFDYAMSDSVSYDEFDCSCGSPNCRGRVTADDWSRLDLQERYRGYFSPYLQRRMDSQK